MTELTSGELHRILAGFGKVLLFAGVFWLSALGVANPVWAGQLWDTEPVEEEPPPATQAQAQLRAHIGPLLATRSLTQDNSDFEHNPSSYFGVQLHLNQIVHTFEDTDAYLFVRLDGGWARTRDEAEFYGLDEDPLSTFSSGSAQLVVLRPLGALFDVDVGVGVQATSFTVEANPIYTGHRYFSAVVSVAGRRWFLAEQFLVGAELAALPVLSLNISAQNPPSEPFGFRGTVEAGWVPVTTGLDIRLRYRYQRYRTHFPSEAGGGNVSEDNQHFLALILGYAL